MTAGEEMMSSLKALAALIHPIEPHQFFSEYWTRRTLHLQHRPIDGPPILTVGRLSEILRRCHTLLTYGEHIRLIGQAGLLPTPTVTELIQTRRRGTQRRLSLAKVEKAIRGGAMLVLEGLDELDDQIAGVANALQRELGETVRANAYLAPPGGAGLSPHYDTHEVFVLQLQGTKHWRIGPIVSPPPLPAQPSADVEPPTAWRDLLLSPGDILYIPRGQWHHAFSEKESSLHLTLGVMCFTGLDALQLLVSKAMDRAALRTNLSEGAELGPPSSEAVRHRLTAILGVLTELVARETIETVPGAVDRPFQIEMEAGPTAVTRK